MMERSNPSRASRCVSGNTSPHSCRTGSQERITTFEKLGCQEKQDFSCVSDRSAETGGSEWKLVVDHIFGPSQEIYELVQTTVPELTVD
jgi:hypothetical protein